MRTWKADPSSRAVRSRLRGAAAISPASAEAQPQSRLYEVTKSKKLRVCQYPLYYSISFRNPEDGPDRGHRRRPRQGAGQGARRAARDRRVRLCHLHRRPAGQQVRDRHVRRRRHLEARAGGRVLQALPRHQHLRRDAQGREDQDLGRHRQEGRQGRRLARQLHRGVHEGLPQERRDGLRLAAEHARGRAGGAARRRHHDGLPDRHQSDRRVRLGRLPAAQGEACRHALRLRGAAGRPDLAQLHQPVRRHHQARRPADAVSPRSTSSTRSSRPDGRRRPSREQEPARGRSAEGHPCSPIASAGTRSGTASTS